MGQPPAQLPPYQPPAPRVRRTTWLAGTLAAVAFIGAAGLVLGGTFADLYHYEYSSDATKDTFDFGWWSSSDEDGPLPEDDGTTVWGIGAAGATALLLLSAVFAFVAGLGSRPTRTSTTVTRVSGSLGAGVAAGVITTVALFVFNTFDSVESQGVEAGERVTFSVGLGVWLPLAGTVVALAGVVLALLPQPGGGMPGRVEPETPRMGVPMPYGAMQQQQQQQPPLGQPQAPGPQSVPIPTAQPPASQVPVAQAPAAPEPPPPPAEPAPTADDEWTSAEAAPDEQDKPADDTPEITQVVSAEDTRAAEQRPQQKNDSE